MSPVHEKLEVRAPVGAVVEQRYRIEARIAQGTIGTVYRAIDVTLGRPVAIKVFRPRPDSERGRRPSLQEANILSLLDHPNIVRLLDRGHTGEGTPFTVMQYLDGKPLASRTKAPMPPERAARIIGDILRGLAHMHSKRVIHRDLRPANLFLVREDGRELVKILDFGAAKRLELERDSGPVTLSGLMSGTPAYMAPEQVISADVDERTDLYSVGIIFYELLTGSQPWDGDDPVLLHHQLHEPLPALPESSGALAGIVRKLTDKERSRRYPTARDALEDLQAYLASCEREDRDDLPVDEPVRPRVAAWKIGLAAGVVSMITAGTVQMSRTAAFAGGLIPVRKPTVVDRNELDGLNRGGIGTLAIDTTRSVIAGSGQGEASLPRISPYGDANAKPTQPRVSKKRTKRERRPKTTVGEAQAADLGSPLGANALEPVPAPSIPPLVEEVVEPTVAGSEPAGGLVAGAAESVSEGPGLLRSSETHRSSLLLHPRNRRPETKFLPTDD